MQDEDIEVFTLGEIFDGERVEFVTPERYEEIIRLNKKGGKNGKRTESS